MQTYLVTDERERCLHDLMATVFEAANVPKKLSMRKQIPVGDYLICRQAPGEPAEIIACIERKTLKDFAKSFGDSRYQNKEKMMKLRDKTGCQLYWLVEGPAFPKDTWTISKTPYGKIRAAMDNLMLRDGFHVIQTKDQLHTAQTMLRFVQVLTTIDTPYKYPEVARTEAEDSPMGATGGVAEPTIPMTLLNSVAQKSSAELVLEIWSALGGVSVVTAQALIKHISVKDLVSWRVSDEDLARIRLPSGRSLSGLAIASLKKVRACVKSYSIILLAKVPGISKTMAAQLLGDDSFALKELLADRNLANRDLHQKGRTVKLGDTRATRILTLLSYKDAGAEESTSADPEELTSADPEEPQIEELSDEELTELLGW